MAKSRCHDNPKVPTHLTPPRLWLLLCAAGADPRGFGSPVPRASPCLGPSSPVSLPPAWLLDRVGPLLSRGMREMEQGRQIPQQEPPPGISGPRPGGRMPGFPFYAPSGSSASFSSMRSYCLHPRIAPPGPSPALIRRSGQPHPSNLQRPVGMFTFPSAQECCEGQVHFWAPGGKLWVWNSIGLVTV